MLYCTLWHKPWEARSTPLYLISRRKIKLIFLLGAISLRCTLPQNGGIFHYKFTDRLTHRQILLLSHKENIVCSFKVGLSLLLPLKFNFILANNKVKWRENRDRSMKDKVFLLLKYHPSHDSSLTRSAFACHWGDDDFASWLKPPYN